MMLPVNAGILVFLGVVLLVEASVPAQATYDAESWDRDRQNTAYDSALTPDEDYLLSLLRSRSGYGILMLKSL
ncbi:unnamed protein product [Ixodes hexagonus]